MRITCASVHACVFNNHGPYPKRYDADGSGSIDANELESLLKDLDFNIRNKGTVKHNTRSVCVELGGFSIPMASSKNTHALNCSDRKL